MTPYMSSICLSLSYAKQNTKLPLMPCLRVVANRTGTPEAPTCWLNSGMEHRDV